MGIGRSGSVEPSGLRPSDGAAEASPAEPLVPNAGDPAPMPSRMRRFLERPPKRLREDAVTNRRTKCIRRGGRPRDWLDECFDEQKGRCCYCGTLMRKKAHKTEAHIQATIDHVIPLSAGGKNSRCNVAAACIRCNAEKGSMPADDYRALWAERKAERKRMAAEQGIASGIAVRMERDAQRLDAKRKSPTGAAGDARSL